MNKKRALVLGGCGLLGGSIADKLSLTGYDVLRADMRAGNSGCHLNIFDSRKLVETIRHQDPELIVNCVNIATLCSHDEAGMNVLLDFFDALYEGMKDLGHGVQYLQMGTTGSGGLGYDIPFTHGDPLDSRPILIKAALSGASSALLVLLSRVRSGNLTIREIKPGFAIFANQIHIDHQDGYSVPLLNGGESGNYTRQELALLTHFMRYSSIDYVVNKVMEVLEGEEHKVSIVPYDIVASLNDAILCPDKRAARKLSEILSKLKSGEGEDPVIVTGNLGPPSLAADLILAAICLKNAGVPLSRDMFSESLGNDESVKRTLDYVSRTVPTLSGKIVEYLHYNRLLELASFSTGGETEPWEIVRNKFETPQVNKYEAGIDSLELELA